METKISQSSRIVIGEKLSEAHELAYKLAAILEELKNDYDLPDEDESALEELYDKADSLQSDLYDFINVED